MDTLKTQGRTLADALQAMSDEVEAKKTQTLSDTFPYVRRDQTVRARILADMGESLLIETIFGKNGDTLKRTVDREYFDNNYWEGKN